MRSEAVGGGDWAGPQGSVAGRNYRQVVLALLPALYIAYILIVWPLTYAGGIVPSDLAQGPVGPSQPFLLNRLFFPGIGALALALLVAERRALNPVSGFPLLALSAFWLYCGATIAWSLAPGVALNKWMLLSFMLIGLGVPVALTRSVEHWLRPIYWVFVAAVALNLVAVAVLPTTPIGHPGIYAHKNTLGSMAGLAIVFSLYGITRTGRYERLSAFIMVPAALLLVMLSQSKTSLGLAAVAPALAVLPVLLRRYLRIPLALVLVALVPPTLVLVMGNPLGISFTDISLLLTGDPTFTGRVELWDFAALMIAERPWLGHGFLTFWEIGNASPIWRAPESFVQATPNAHNGYLDLMLHLGVVGTGLFVLLVLAAAGWATRITDRHAPTGWFLTSLLIFLCLHNVMESTWFDIMSFNGALFTLMVMGAVFRQTLWVRKG